MFLDGTERYGLVHFLGVTATLFREICFSVHSHERFNARQEYGGKEIDLIIEDYKKKYITVEIKSNSGKSQDIFPIKNRSEIINSINYFEKLSSIFIQ